MPDPGRPERVSTYLHSIGIQDEEWEYTHTPYGVFWRFKRPLVEPEPSLLPPPDPERPQTLMERLDELEEFVERETIRRAEDQLRRRYRG